MNPEEYPLFLFKIGRDVYLDKLIANGHQIEAKTVFVHGEKYYTVEDIDQRKGK
jgi:hypothetical protein